MARPRTRTGDEIQVSFQLPPDEYAQLAGYVAVLQDAARREKQPVSEATTRSVIRTLWAAHWKSLTPAFKRAVRARPEFKNNPRVAAAKKSPRLKRSRKKL